MLMFSRVLLPTRCQVEGMRLHLWSEDRLLKPAREFEERDFFPGIVLEAGLEGLEDFGLRTQPPIGVQPTRDAYLA